MTRQTPDEILAELQGGIPAEFVTPVDTADTYVEAWQLACSRIGVGGPRTCCVRVRGGGLVRASLEDGGDIAIDRRGRSMMRIIDAHYQRHPVR